MSDDLNLDSLINLGRTVNSLKNSGIGSPRGTANRRPMSADGISSLPEGIEDQIKKDVIAQIKPILDKKPWMRRALSTGWLVCAFIFLLPTLGIWTMIAMMMRGAAVSKLAQLFTRRDFVKIYNSCLQKVVKGFKINSVTQGATHRVPFRNHFYNGNNSSTFASGTYFGRYNFETGDDYRFIPAQKEDESDQYLWYRYFVITTDFDQEYDTIVIPENALTRTFKGHNQSELESMEFEKIFNMDYKDPVMLRRVFTPDVMLKMTDIVKNAKGVKIHIPDIFIHNNYLGFRWNLGDNGSRYFAKEVLFEGLISGGKNANQIADKFCKKLVSDLNRFNTAVQWIMALQLLKSKTPTNKI